MPAKSEKHPSTEQVAAKSPRRGAARRCAAALRPRFAQVLQLNVLCGWLLHCKSFLAISAVVFVSTVVCPACLCGGVVATGPDEFRERGSNRLIDLRGPLTFPECPCSWLT